MAVRIVVALEAVQIEHGDGERRTVVARLVKLAVQMIVHGAMVETARPAAEHGQRVQISPWQSL